MTDSRSDASGPGGRPDSGEVARRLRDVFGEELDPQVSLRPEDTSDARGARAGEAAEELGGYRVRGEIARGGQGVVLEVWDRDLRRHLAMKVSGRRGRSERQMLSRFLEEAQVTGQLDHPAIVPVHELGADERGRVFFTMKLVKGRELGEMFELVRAGDRSWTQTRALGVILRVCEAIGPTRTTAAWCTATSSPAT